MTLPTETSTIAKKLLFTREEYAARLQAARRFMREREIDVLLVDQTEFLFYLTGFGPSENRYRVCVVPLDGEPIMLLRSIDEPPFLEQTWLADYVGFADWEDPVGVLAAVLRKRGWADARLGIDEDSYCLPPRRFRAMREALPKAQFKDFSGVLEKLRARKSPREIEYIRQAARIADLAMHEAIAAAGEGRTERDAAAAASFAFVRHGADSGRTGPITAGTGWGFLHGHLHDRPMAPGDILHMELIPSVCGYSARVMRPTVIKRGSDEQHRAAQRLVAIQDEQIAAMRPGAAAKDIDRICREQVLGAGLRQTYDNITGYTLGYYPPSTPRTSDFTRIFLPTSEWLLEEGMVFHIYASAWGIAFSETVLVTADGSERLTKTDRKMFVA